MGMVAYKSDRVHSLALLHHEVEWIYSFFSAAYTSFCDNCYQTCDKNRITSYVFLRTGEYYYSYAKQSKYVVSVQSQLVYVSLLLKDYIFLHLITEVHRIDKLLRASG